MRAALLSLLVVACSGDPAPPSPTPRAPAAEPGEASQTPPPLGEACARAVECCEAYAAAMPNVSADSACAGAREDDPAACARMRRGWRAALEQMGDVPGACAD